MNIALHSFVVIASLRERHRKWHTLCRSSPLVHNFLTTEWVLVLSYVQARLLLADRVVKSPCFSGIQMSLTPSTWSYLQIRVLHIAHAVTSSKSENIQVLIPSAMLLINEIADRRVFVQRSRDGWRGYDVVATCHWTIWLILHSRPSTLLS